MDGVLTMGEPTCAHADSTTAPSEANMMTPLDPGINQISLHLPFPARSILMRASQTPITSEDAFARVRAIQEAQERVRREFPEYFRAPASLE